MAAADLVSRMRRQRESWFELDEPPRRALLLRRPQTAELLEFSTGKIDQRQTRKLVLEAIVDWRGFTDAELIGQALGSDQVAEFSRDVFEEWAGDHIEEITRASVRLMEMVTKHAEATGAAAKN